jgi:hypothetical protein
MSNIGFILGQLGQTLVADVAPKLEGDYAGGHAAMAGLMAVMAGEAWDGAADRLVREVEGIRQILEEGGVEACEIQAAPDLRISSLETERDLLALKLISLQARLEAEDSERARTLNGKIWAHYMATSQARMPSPPVFPDADTD